jgi:hypothetical protein
MVDPHFKGFGVVHTICWEGKIFVYYRWVWLICGVSTLGHAYKYQNSSIACEILVTTYTHQSIKNTSLYEFTKIDYDMALLVV